MDLKDFVKETIVQIIQGIEEANKELVGSDAFINPQYVWISDNPQVYGETSKRSSEHDNPDSRFIQKIEFDVAVVAETGKKGSAGAKISIASIGFGSDGKTESTKRSESRISFSIPVVFPSHKNEC